MRIVISTAMDAQEKKRKCGVCGQLGHNARTCSYGVPQPRPVPVPRRCGSCGMFGHNSRTCFPVPASNNTYQAPTISHLPLLTHVENVDGVQPPPPSPLPSVVEEDREEETSSKRSCTSSENLEARIRNITLLLLDNDVVVGGMYNHLKSLELKVFDAFQKGSMIERVARLEDTLM